MNKLFPLVFSFLLATNNCVVDNSEYKKTQELEGVIRKYEYSNVSKQGLWTDISLGVWNHFNGNFAISDSFLNQDLSSIEKYGSNKFVGTKAIDYYILGLNSIAKRDFRASFENIKKAEREFERIGYKNGIARCYHAKALNYKAQRHYYFAIEYLSEALKIAKKSYSEKKHVGTRGLINEIRKEIGNVLEITGGEFEGKNSYEWWTENFHD